MDPLYPVDKNHPLVSRKYAGLLDIAGGPTGDEQRLQHNLAAEEWLGLTEPAFTGDRAERITRLVARQIGFQLEQGFTPVIQSATSTNVGATATSTTQYRDRYLDPVAANGIERETGVKTVRLTPRVRGTA